MFFSLRIPRAEYTARVAGGVACRAGPDVRDSTNDQQILPMQSHAMREYAVGRGWTIAVHILEVGANAEKRETGERLLEAAGLLWRLSGGTWF
jgi:hypothetical protein